MLRKIVSIIFLILSLHFCFAQEITIQSDQNVYIDHFGNIYILKKDNFSLISGKQTKEYQNSFLGNIYSVDVGNPLRILVYHKEANEIVFLNNELSIIGDPINLDELNLPDVSAVCNSEINGFWIFNKLNNKVEYYNSNIKKVHSSMDLSQQISNLDDIQNIKMYNKRIYLRVKDTGILVFDMFATYIKTIPIKQATNFQVLDHSILYSTKNKVLTYNFETLETTSLLEDKNQIKYAFITGAKLYYLSNNKLKIISLSNLQ